MYLVILSKITIKAGNDVIGRIFAESTADGMVFVALKVVRKLGCIEVTLIETPAIKIVDNIGYKATVEICTFLFAGIINRR